MSKNKYLIVMVVFLVSIFGFASCELEEGEGTATIAERIVLLEKDLNYDNYAGVYENFHPDMASYDSYKDERIIDSGVMSKAYVPFNFGPPSISGEVATGTFKHDGGAFGTYTATMKEDGTDNWKILVMIISAGGDSITYSGISQ